MRILMSVGVMAALALSGGAAFAAPITKIFTVNASGFSDLTLSTTPPTDPVTLRFSLTFDPASGDQFDYSAGLALLSSSVSIAGPVAFDYDSASDTLTFGGAGLSTAITAGTNDVLAEVTSAYTGTPSFGGLEYTTAATPGIYLSLTGSVSAAAVPEPGSLVLALTGLAAFGARRRRA